MKTTWNYRVLAFNYVNRDTSGTILKICEVYYSDEIPNSYKELGDVSAETVRDLKWSLGKMKEALNKPIIDAEDFPNEYKL